MGKGKQSGENSKKAQGNARKAEAAAQKQDAVNAKKAAEEDALWDQGSKKKNAKAAMDEEKREEARRKKAEREAEEEAEAAEFGKKKPLVKQKKAGNKPVKSSGGGLDAALANSSLSAHNIDDAISALEITSGKTSDKVDRHPERRFKAALKAYQDARMPELRQEHPGLRKNQYENLMYEEFKKSPENPFNQVTVEYDASRDEVQQKLDNVRNAKEDKLRH